MASAFERRDGCKIGQNLKTVKSRRLPTCWRGCKKSVKIYKCEYILLLWWYTICDSEVAAFKHPNSQQFTLPRLSEISKKNWRAKVLIANFWQSRWFKLKFIYSEMATKFCEISASLHRAKVRRGFRKILWPAQNIWTLIATAIILSPYKSKKLKGKSEGY